MPRYWISFDLGLQGDYQPVQTRSRIASNSLIDPSALPNFWFARVI